MLYFPQDRIDQYYPGAVMIPPMKVWKLPKGKEDKRMKICREGKYFAQPKIDGSCYVYEKTKHGKSYLFSRRVSTKTGLLVEKGDRVPHIMEYFDSIFPSETVVVTEIFYPFEKSRNVTSIMGCLAPKAIARQKNKPLNVYLHDVLQYDGNLYLNHEAQHRYELLQHITSDKTHPNFMRIAEYITEDIDYYIEECLDEGYEGAILKLKTSIYHPDKKPAWQMVKFKVEEEHDVICIGFEPPTREYKGRTPLEQWKCWEGDTPVTKPYANGWIGALRIGAYKGEEIADLGTVASGLTDALLEEIKQDPNKFLGEPLTIKAMETTDNNLREKRFIRFRDDINPTDCTWSKIFD